MKNIFNLSASPVTLKRLAEYFCRLSQLPDEVSQISSSQLAEMMDTNPSQLRQDFHHFGGFGKPGHPYDVHILKAELGKIFGVIKPLNLVLVGATSIARCLVKNQTLLVVNLHIKGIVDPEADKQGQDFEGLTVMAPTELPDFVKKANIRIGGICTLDPKKALELLTDCGIKGIWNLSPVFIRPPKGIYIHHENLAAGLLTLAYDL